MLLGAGGLVAFGAAGAGLAHRAEADAYRQYADALRTALPQPASAQSLVRYASLAASGHNAQPWKFHLQENAIAILPDFDRRTPVVDPDDHHLFVSLGCALENLSVAAAASRMPGNAEIAPDPRDGVRFVFAAPAATDAITEQLFAAIPRRQSSRTLYDGRPVDMPVLRKLMQVSQSPGADLALLTGRSRIDPIRDLVISGNTAQMADTAFLRELKEWLRFSPGQAMARGDGLYAAASGSPVLPDWAGPIAFDLFFKAEAENDKYAKQMDSSAGVAVFSAETEGPAGWIAVGRACQRFCLMATALGLKLAFVNQPVERSELRTALAAAAGIAGRRPDLVLRFGHGPALPYSPRRDAATIMMD